MYSPELLLTNTRDWLSFAFMFVTALAGIATLAVGLEGYLHTGLTMPERTALCAAALCMIIPGILTDAAGLSVLAIVYRIAKNRADKTARHSGDAPRPDPPE